MTARFRRQAASAAVATALLCATVACSSDDSSDAPADGADGNGGGGSDTEGSGEANGDAGEHDHEYPDIELPEDVEAVFEWEIPDDPDEADAVEVTQNFLGSIAVAIAEQNPNHPDYEQYAVDGARQHAAAEIEAWVAEGLVMNGTDRYHDLAVDTAGGALTVEFCRDTGELSAEEADGGESTNVPGTDDADLADHSRFSVMLADIGAEETALLATKVQVTEQAEECAS